MSKILAHLRLIQRIVILYIIFYSNSVIIPFVPSTRTLCPSFNIFVTLSIATTQGIPYSLEAIAAWEPALPISVTTANATLKRGVHTGAV